MDVGSEAAEEAIAERERRGGGGGLVSKTSGKSIVLVKYETTVVLNLFVEVHSTFYLPIWEAISTQKLLGALQNRCAYIASAGRGVPPRKHANVAVPLNAPLRDWSGSEGSHDRS